MAWIVARTAVDDGIDAVMVFPHLAPDLHFTAAYAQHEAGGCLVKIEGIASGGIELRHDVFSRAETLNMAIMYHKYCMYKQYFLAVGFYVQGAWRALRSCAPRSEASRLRRMEPLWRRLYPLQSCA
jgi:hypothetical protein